MKDKHLNLLRKLLIKPKKSKEDLRAIYEHFRHTPLKDTFFKLILAIGKGEDFLHHICRGLKYKFFAKGEVIFEEGEEKTDHIYFVIRGKVGVFVKTIFQLVESKSNASEKNAERNSIFESFAPKLTNTNIFSDYQSSLLEASEGPSQRMSLVAGKNLPRNSLFPFGEFKGSVLGSFRSSKVAFDCNSLQEKENENARGNINASFTLNAGFFKHLDVQAVFNPQNAEQLRLSQTFELLFLKDKTEVPQEQLAEFEAQFGNKVCELTEWQLFGERAKEQGRRRTATIIPLTNTEVVKIRQSDYQNIIKNALLAKKQGLATFLSEALWNGTKGIEQPMIYSLFSSVEVA